MLVNPLFNILPVNQTLNSDGLTSSALSNNQFTNSDGYQLYSPINGSSNFMNRLFYEYGYYSLPGYNGQQYNKPSNAIL